MAQGKTKDMTQGAPLGLILGFFWPVVAGLLFQQLYVFVDTIIVGRFLGTVALAAVGCTSSVTMLTTGFCVGACSGFAIPIARSFGEHSEPDLRRYAANSYYLTAALTLVMTLGTLLGCDGILRLMNTQDDILPLARIYLLVLFCGMPARYIYNMLAAMIRSFGESRFPLICLVASSLTNIALDLVAVLVLHIGVAGAALATIVSEYLAALMCFVYIRRYAFLRMTRDELRPDRATLRELCGAGLPMGLQSSITMIGLVVMQTAVNAMGTVAVAAMTAYTKITYLFDCPFAALGTTIATFASQNHGARRIDRIQKGVRLTMIIGIIYSILALIVIALFGRWMASLFVSGDADEVIHYAYMISLWVAVFYVLCTAINVLRYTLQGVGFTKIAMFAGVFEMIARSCAGLWLVPAFGYAGIYFASPLAWVFALAFLLPVYLRTMRELRLLMPPVKNLSAED